MGIARSWWWRKKIAVPQGTVPPPRWKDQASVKAVPPTATNREIEELKGSVEE